MSVRFFVNLVGTVFLGIVAANAQSLIPSGGGGGGAPSGPAGGDLSGTYPNPSIASVPVTAQANSFGVRWKLAGANVNTTADQPVTVSLPAGATDWRPFNIIFSNPSISLTTAVCGVWTGPGKTGTTLVGSGATGVVLSALTNNTSGSAGSLTTAVINNINTAMYTVAAVPTLYFACSTAQGAPATVDVIFTINVLN